MKLSLNWLKDFLLTSHSVDAIIEALTFAGVEVEGVEKRGANFGNVVVAQIDAFGPHPNADRLSVCRVNDGTNPARQIVCGARNFQVGDKVPLALPGTILPNGAKISAAKLRGVESEGMLCSAKELNIAEDSAGLLILPEDAPIGAPLSQIFPPDTILELETTPNRGDLLSHFGIARELAALLGLPAPVLPKIRTRVDQMREDANLVRLEAQDGCPFYTARLVRGVRVGPSPGWLAQRLESVGIRSINNVVDVTNYVLMEIGQPLHAFDRSKIETGIVVRRARPQEKLTALDGREYALEPGDVVIADEKNALAIAGVMGGEGSGVSTTTQDLLLESAYFNPLSIRLTSRRLGLISDSSFRFERGVDPQMVLFASARATDLLLETCGGTADEQVLVAGSAPDLSHVAEMRPERCTALLGMEVPNARELLSRLGLSPSDENRWLIPSFRQDLYKEADLIEEVCRLVDVQKIPSRVIAAATKSSGADRVHDDLMRLRQRLVGLGLFEARTLTLVDNRALDFLLEPKPLPLELRNPLAEDQAMLRPTLLSGLVRAAERNFNRGATRVALFEIGRVFRAGEKEEFLKLGLVVSGERQPKSWNQSTATFDLFDLKGILQASLQVEFALARAEPTRFTPLVCNVIDGWGRVLGKIGQIRPGLGKELGARNPVFLGEIGLPINESEQRFQYKPLDRYPAVSRDIAFVAERELKYQRVIETLRAANEPLLQEISLFDLFIDPSGEKVPLNKKSMALSLTYRASDRTLTQEEVNEAHGRLKLQLVQRLGVVLRE
jgi:phenylalanyl-tRNA synthetase beta chain